MIKTISEGKIDGSAIIIESVDDIYKKDIVDKVVIIQKLDPKLLSHLFSVRGIILEEGSILSHVAIFLREVNIPCKIIPNAKKVYKQGEKIYLE